MAVATLGEPADMIPFPRKIVITIFAVVLLSANVAFAQTDQTSSEKSKKANKKEQEKVDAKKKKEDQLVSGEKQKRNHKRAARRKDKAKKSV